MEGGGGRRGRRGGAGCGLGGCGRKDTPTGREVVSKSVELENEKSRRFGIGRHNNTNRLQISSEIAATLETVGNVFNISCE